MEKLFLVDAYAQIFRSYYAFISRPMRNRENLNTSAIFGFTKFLREIIISERPHYLGVAFDPRGGNFRHQLYPAYKANRSETPEDIIASIPYIKRILEALGIPILEVLGYEADDVIGTLSHKAAKEGFDVYMVTPDKDFGQLIQKNVKIYKQRKGVEGIEIVGTEQIKEHYGFDDPRKVIDILAIWGDSADNIPGVPGIGEKGAIRLVNQFGTIEDILANTDSLTGKQKENIIASQEQLLLSKVLATIALDVPIEFEPEKLAMEQPDCLALREIYKELDFNMFIREMDSGKKTPFNEVICPETHSNEDQEPQTELPKDLFGNPIEQPKKVEPKEEVGGLDLFAQAQIYDTIETVEHNYIIADTPEKIEQAIVKMRAAGRFAFDTETTGLDYFGSRIVGLSLCCKPFEAYYIPINSPEVLNYLKPLFKNEKIEKVGQNIKFDLIMLHLAGVEVKGRLWDTMILHYLLDPEARHNMNYLAQKYLNYLPVEIETLIGKGKNQLTMDRVALEQIAPYCAEDSDVTLRLYEILHPKVREAELENLYLTIEEPLIRTLAKIEIAGVKIDVVQLAEYAKELNFEMTKLEDQIRTLSTVRDLNINSARQLGVVLFEVLKIDSKPKRTKTKQYSTDEEYLQFLSDRHPIVPIILEYRKVKKLLSTYIEALPQLVSPVTGRIHTSFNQAVTATGRLSSTNPNLQNIPIREEQGRQIRKAFVPSSSDHILVAADYSQVELRLMAHLSGDQAMIDAFRKGEDIHRDTASRLFHVAPEEVTSDQRRMAKTANFGIIYGISSFGLKQRISNITMGEAKEIIEGYFASYPKVKEYMDKIIDSAHQKGYVETIFGRRRILEGILSSNSNVRSLAERNAINAPIQGSAADIIKIAMNNVMRRFEDEGIESKVILQVHDELVLDVLKTELEQVKIIVRESMEGATQLSIPLTVDIGVGENWLEAH